MSVPLDQPADESARDRDVTLLYLIKQVELAVRQALDDVVATADLTTLQYTALTVLERHPGITSAELARNSFVRAQTMAEMVTYLLGRGLVTRERDETNRKQYLLTLTSEGQRVLDELFDAVADIETKMLDGFDGGQTEILRTYLLRCRHSLSGEPRGSAGVPVLLPHGSSGSFGRRVVHLRDHRRGRRTRHGRGGVSRHEQAAPSSASGHDRDVTLLYLIKQVELAVRQALDDVVATADLTTLQYTALTVLERHPGITSAELARNSFVRAQSMAEMVTYLLGRGLVTRERDERNRKQYLLSLSAAGQRVLDELYHAVADIESAMLEGFDAGQTEILRTYLVRCRRSLSGGAPR